MQNKQLQADISESQTEQDYIVEKAELSEDEWYKLQKQKRLLKFRERHPDGIIVTDFKALNL